MPKAMRVIIGVLLMTAFVLVISSLVVRKAGAWGVPYFSYNTERGSSCKNALTSVTCTPVTLADVEFYGEVDLPPNTRVTSARYHATHDYELNAQLVAPRSTAAAAQAALTESFGACKPDHPAPMPTAGLTALCVMANDDAVTSEDQSEGRLYAVGTGLRKDGSRLIVMAIKSR
jgi:hypothetical protein